MMPYHSVYAPLLNQYIAFKRSYGLKFRMEYALKELDDFFFITGASTLGVTREQAELWARRRPNEADSNLSQRILNLNGFCRYLINVGYPSFVPQLRKPHSTFTPRILTHEEMARLFKAADERAVGRRTQSSSSHSKLFPVALRLLYATGMRAGELVALTVWSEYDLVYTFVDRALLETEGGPMDNKRYTLEEKIKFLDALEKKGTVASAARSMGIHNDDVCYRWARKKDELRAAYSLSRKPGRPVKQVRRRGSKIPLQDKIQCIMAIDEGMSIRRASVEFNKNLASVQSWYRSKEELLALYYSQQKASVEKDSSPPDTAWEVQMAKEQADEHLVKRCKALAKENEYLKDRVMFLEKLNEILRQRSGPVKKKKSSKQSACALSKEDE